MTFKHFPLLCFLHHCIPDRLIKIFCLLFLHSLLNFSGSHLIINLLLKIIVLNFFLSLKILLDYHLLLMRNNALVHFFLASILPVLHLPIKNFHLCHQILVVWISFHLWELVIRISLLDLLWVEGPESFLFFALLNRLVVFFLIELVNIMKCHSIPHWQFLVQKCLISSLCSFDWRNWWVPRLQDRILVTRTWGSTLRKLFSSVVERGMVQPRVFWRSENWIVFACCLHLVASFMNPFHLCVRDLICCIWDSVKPMFKVWRSNADMFLWSFCTLHLSPHFKRSSVLESRIQMLLSSSSRDLSVH